MRRAQQLGRYHLLDRIAFGGMAEIYRAKTFDATGLVTQGTMTQFSFWNLIALIQIVIAIQVIVGGILFLMGHRPDSNGPTWLHYVYGAFFPAALLLSAAAPPARAGVFIPTNQTDRADGACDSAASCPSEPPGESARIVFVASPSAVRPPSIGSISAMSSSFAYVSSAKSRHSAAEGVTVVPVKRSHSVCAQGGINGAVASAALAGRGASVALIDRGDFGGGTSFNNAKTVHGGVRSLQRGHLGEMRQYLRELHATIARTGVVTLLLWTVVMSAPAYGVSTCGGRTATILGTAGDDQLTGTPQDDVIAGLSGNDWIRGLGGETPRSGRGQSYDTARGSLDLQPSESLCGGCQSLDRAVPFP